MLPKKRRIPRSLFPQTINGSYFFNSKSLNLRVYKSADEKKPSKVSFITSKKVSSKAVERNLVRRRGYSIFKPLMENIKPSLLLIFALKKEVISVTFEDLKAEINDLLRKAEAFK